MRRRDAALAARYSGQVARLKRVTIRLNRHAVQSSRVNPLTIIKLEQIHAFYWDRKAIPTKRDLL
jgi:hypothetical protein